MEASINFDGTLSGAISGGGGGGGSDVVITPVVTSGTKIADVSVNEVEKDLYCPSPTEVTVDQVLQSGTKIASIEVNGQSVDLYAPTPSAPTEVIVTQVQQSGTKIATIGVNGQNTDIYAPESGGHEYSTTEHVIGQWIDGSLIYEKTIACSGLRTTTQAMDISNLYDFSDVKFFINAMGHLTSTNEEGCFQLNMYRYQTTIYLHCLDDTYLDYITIHYTKLP